MKKILPVEKIREADAQTIKNEPISSIDLMERASMQCVEWIEKHLQEKNRIYIFCGPGNNGGDGLAIARLLSEKGFVVKTIVLSFTDKYSDDFKINRERLAGQEKSEIIELDDLKKFPEIQDESIVIDAIFGSGLSKPVEGFVAKVIDEINKLKCIKIAIDIPSGLFADKHSASKDAAIIRADYTLSFQFPKLAFLMAENDTYTGKWEILPIGLDRAYIESVAVSGYFMEKDDFPEIYKKRSRVAHKGNFGHALLIAGSLGKMGAAVLSSKSCLRSGVGLLTTHVPYKGNDIMQTSVPEAMLSLGRFENYLSDVPDLDKYSAIAVGPGIGTEEQSRNALKVLIQNSRVPIIFDADAVNILAKNKTWLAFLPKGCVLTPHPGEFERLAGKTSDDFERAALAREFAIKYGVVLVLKGANTQIATPVGDCFYNPTGNPGMATAGSGDVLTGIILALMAQGYNSVYAAMIGVYVHGLAGDLAAKKTGQTSLVAGDIVNYLGKAFKTIE